MRPAENGEGRAASPSGIAGPPSLFRALPAAVVGVAAACGWVAGYPGVVVLPLLGAALFVLNAQRRRVEELSRANRELDRVAVLAAHELKSPLRRIRIFVESVREGAGPRLGSNETQSLERAVDSASRLQDLVDALLAYAGMEARDIEVRRVDINELMGEIFQDIAPALNAAGAEARSGMLPVVRGDPALLRSLFANLVDNALKYRGPRPPRIDVRARREGDEWIVSVADNGVGIEPKQSQRIFEMFERAARGAGPPGNGIGLAICKRAAEIHGGRIWAEPAAGGGTVFHVALAD